MDGEPWTELLKAFKKFIESRIRINNDNEIISIIVFDETAKIILIEGILNFIMNQNYAKFNLMVELIMRLLLHKLQN